MKKIVFIFALLALNLAAVFSLGVYENEPVNVQELELDGIDTIKVSYRSEIVALYRNNSDTLIIKEYLPENNSNLFAKISKFGNELVVEAGDRPFRFFNTRRVAVEIFLPVNAFNFILIYF